MSYYDDQEDAWFENECQGSPSDYDPFDADSWPRNSSPERNRSRNLLALSKIEEFSAWAVAQGFKRETPKGTYEILRLRKKGESPVLFFKRDKGEHSTSYGEGTELVKLWINTRKQPKEE